LFKSEFMLRVKNQRKDGYGFEWSNRYTHVSKKKILKVRLMIYRDLWLYLKLLTFIK